MRVWNANVPNEGIEVIQWGRSGLVVVLPTRVLYSTHSWYCRVPSSDLVSGSGDCYIPVVTLHVSSGRVTVTPKCFSIRVPGIQSVILAKALEENPIGEPETPNPGLVSSSDISRKEPLAQVSFPWFCLHETCVIFARR